MSAPPTKEPRRWRVAITVWSLALYLNVLAAAIAVMSSAGNAPGNSAYLILAVPMLWLFASFASASWIQKRPPESFFTAVIGCACIVGTWLYWGSNADHARRWLHIRPSYSPWYALSAAKAWIQCTVLYASLPSLIAAVVLKNWTTWTSTTIVTLGAITLTVALRLPLDALWPPGSWAFAATAAAWTPSFTAAILTWSCCAPPCDRWWLYQCRNCRYDLAGNTTGTCPECGIQVDIERSDGSSRSIKSADR